MTTFVVLGPNHAHATAGNHAGRIKAVRFGPSIMSPLLEVEWIVRDGRRVGCKGLHLTAEEREKGSMFLAEMYRAEGREADYERYVAREKAILAGMVVDPLDEFDPRLPAQLVAWRRDKGITDKFQWDAATAAPAPVEALEDIPVVEALPPSAAPIRRARAATADAPGSAS
jgi:hypothetical protein